MPSSNAFYNTADLFASINKNVSTLRLASQINKMLEQCFCWT